MASMVERRAAKALRRKAAARKRRVASIESSLPLIERVRRSAAGPIHHCMIHDELFEHGLGTLILTREAATGELAMGAFLVDVFCLGIKDVAFQYLDAWELELYIAATARAAPLVPVDPSYARKLLRDVASYAESIGFRPHRDFAAVETLFGDVRAEACDATFRFGLDGKPFYVVGPSESAAKIRNRLARLHNRLGDGGFDFMIPLDDDEVIASRDLAAVME